jgi:hypothetical protein
MYVTRDGLHDLLEAWVFTSSKSIYYGICQIVFGEIEHVISYQFGVFMWSG